MTKIRPSGIVVDQKEHLVTIHWADDHESTYTFQFLRRICPCVGCKLDRDAESSGQQANHVPLSTDESLGLIRAETVGAYAIKFTWSDGHSAGIYSWELLRNNCQCDTCTKNEA